MNILILDDNEIEFSAPADYFVDPHDYRLDTVVQVNYPALFWEEYPKLRWDEIWIDHDLGLLNENGRTITKQIEFKGFHGHVFHEKFVITTMNPAVQRNMVSDIERYGRVELYPISFMRDLGVNRGLVIKEQQVLRRNP